MHYFSDYSFIEQDENARSLSFYSKKEITVIDSGILSELRRIGLEKGENVRISLHNSVDDDLHNMMIFQHNGTYTRPHKHILKSETYHIIEGNAVLVVFNEDGTVRERIDMAIGKTLLCRVGKNCYHTIVPTTEYVIFHESRPGPFLRESDSIFAPWSVEPSEKEMAMGFINTLLQSRP